MINSILSSIFNTWVWIFVLLYIKRVFHTENKNQLYPYVHVMAFLFFSYCIFYKRVLSHRKTFVGQFYINFSKTWRWHVPREYLFTTCQLWWKTCQLADWTVSIFHQYQNMPVLSIIPFWRIGVERYEIGWSLSCRRLDIIKCPLSHKSLLFYL